MPVRNKNKYLVLRDITSSADDKRMVFNFENGFSFEWSIIDQKFYHSDTQSEFANIHFKNIVWGENIKPGKIGFFDSLESLAKEGWVKNFLSILSYWLDDRIDHQRKILLQTYVRYGNRMNKLETLSDKDVVYNIESLAKNNYIQEMNLRKVCNDAFRNGRIRSFKEIKEDGLDNWFLSRAGLRPSARYLRSQYRTWENNDIYEDVNRQYVLGNYIETYRLMNKNDMVDIFKYVWDKHQYAFCFSQWGFRNFKERVDLLLEKGYEYKRLMDYIFDDLNEQGLSSSMVHNVDLDHLTILVDYVKMSSEMNANFDKYPKYLKTAHDIASKNYRVKQSQALVEKYQKVTESLKNKEFETDKYCIKVPETLDCIVKEGSSLHHCVASYIDSVVEEKTTIMFLRKSETPDESLVTIELSGNKVRQARGHSNRTTTQEEKDFIQAYESWLENKNSQKNLEFEMV